MLTTEGAFVDSYARFGVLVDWLAGGQAAGMTHAELEDRLHTDGTAVLRQLLQDSLDLRASREQRLDEVSESDGRVRRYSSVYRGNGLATLERVNATLRDLAAQHAKTPGQIALRWLVQRHVLPIPGAKTGPQAADNAAALSFVLAESEMDALNTASS